MFKPTTTMWQPSASILFKCSLLSSAIAAIGLTTGCTTTPTKAPPTQTLQAGSGLLDASSLNSLEDLLSATDMRAVEGDRLLILKHGDVWKRMTVGFKMDENRWDPRIDAQRGWFVSRQPYIDRLSARASRYLYHTVKEAERRGLPTELALLPIIESSYDPAATSSAAAAGMWQFIPSTGKIYGLRQTGGYDGRRDVVESTRAAYEFLGSLYNQFGSWELALAAYNAGPGRIQQAINRNQAAGLPTDYWSLRLPQETMNYVPRFLAVAQIIKNPSQYGVSLPPIANRPHFREINVPAGSSLTQIANTVGLSRAELYQLNPGHRGEYVDSSSTLKMLIPADTSPTIDAKIRNLKPGSTDGLWAGGVTSTTPPASVSHTITPSVATPPAMQTQGSTASVVQTINTAQTQTSRVNTAATTTQPVTTPATKYTPQGSEALAAFASNSDIPSAPRIPVAVTQAANIQPVRVEPPLSAKELEQIQAAVKAEGAKDATQVLQPQASQAEKEEVVREIKAIAPQGTEIVDPNDGKIKLTAIQTSQSVAEQKGQDVSVGFAYPKSMTDVTPATSVEAQLNKDKNFTKTDTEVVVVPPRGKRSTYVVMPGDTLAIIASKNGVNWRDVAKWNQVDPNGTLYVGTTLYLYDAKPPAETPAPVKKRGKVQSYIVKPNDSLTGVAEQFGMSVADLATLNDLKVTSNLLVGQKLVVHGNVQKNTTEQRDQSREKSRDQKHDNKIKTKVYTVKRGEFLKAIADRYALSVQELVDLTPGLTSTSSLLVGQKINVPLHEVNANDDKLESKVIDQQKFNQVKAETAYKTTNIKTENYRVQSGDTLSSIASQSKMTLSDLADLNQLSISKGLMVGQVIKIPAGSTVPDSYTVQSGDSLTAVAAKYNLSTAKIAELNGLNASSGLFVGQKLKLSGEVEQKAATTTRVDEKKDRAEGYHTVKAGESLALIARKYKLQLNYLAELNGLSKSSAVHAGQRLKIEGDLPAKSSAQKSQEQAGVNNRSNSKYTAKNTEKYTVGAGESLHTIAGKSGISVEELADLNKLTSKSRLQRGQSIIVPKTSTSYKVRSGDNLIRLASKYGISTAALAELNDMNSNTQLKIGEVIKVPVL